MLTGFEKPTYVGVVMDLDDFKMRGNTAIHHIKKELCEFSQKLGHNSRIYVGGNEDMPRTSGESVSQIVSYHISNDLDPLRQKFKDCVQGVGSQDGLKIVILLTNRYSKSRIHDFRVGFEINRRQSLGCDIHLFEVRRSSEDLPDMVESMGGTYHFANDESELRLLLQDILREQGYV